MSFSRVVSAAGVLAMPVAPAAAQIKTVPGEHHTITATVEAIEQSSRELTLRDTAGQVRTIRVPDEGGAAAYGPYGGRAVADAWNPRTGTYARTRQGGNIYGHWGSNGVQRGDD